MFDRSNDAPKAVWVIATPSEDQFDATNLPPGSRVELGSHPTRSAVQVILQRLQVAVPVAGQGGEELLRHLHRCGVQPEHHPTLLARLRDHQAGVGQQAQVLGDALPGDRQPFRQVRGRGLSLDTTGYRRCRLLRDEHGLTRFGKERRRKGRKRNG